MKKLAAALVGLGITFTAFAQGGHEHGVARLQVAIDGGQLAIELQSPLDNLVGFEHEPSTEAQRRALADAEARLRDFGALFVLPVAAGCMLSEVELESPWHAGHDEAHDHEQDHECAHDHEEAHGEMHVRYLLNCTRPEALTGMTVKLAEAFPRTARIRTETATPRGQNALTLTRGKDKLPL